VHVRRIPCGGHRKGWVGDGDNILADRRSACQSVSDRGKVVVSMDMQNLCARVETDKILTCPYAPQTDVMIERFNATLCRDLAKFVTHEED
jgi:transposase InsO family protein